MGDDPQATDGDEARRTAPSVPKLVDLFFRPSVFFSTTRLDAPKWYLPILLAWGATGASARIDQRIMEAELGQARAGWEQLSSVLLGSWPSMWIFLLTLGALGGLFHWFIGGWWYRVRLRWSGASAPSPKLARLVMTWSALVLAGPTVVALVIETAVFPDYQAYWDSDEVASSLLLLFPIWSIVASYKGVRARFDVSVWKSRVWFLILPVVLFLVAFGALATLYALFG